MSDVSEVSIKATEHSWVRCNSVGGHVRVETVDGKFFKFGDYETVRDPDYANSYVERGEYLETDRNNRSLFRKVIHTFVSGKAKPKIAYGQVRQCILNPDEIEVIDAVLHAKFPRLANSEYTRDSLAAAQKEARSLMSLCRKVEGQKLIC
jgi:hypothetical protein